MGCTNGTDTGTNGNTSSTNLQTFVINYFLGLIFLFIFCIVRTKIPHLFYPRCNRSIQNAPPLLPKSFFGWMYPVYLITEKDILRDVGVDAFVCLRCFKFCLLYFFIAGLFGLVTVLPVNMTGGGGSLGFSKTTFQNVEAEDHVAWVHVVSLYFNSFLFYYLVVYNYVDLTMLRRKYMGQQVSEHLYSVMVSELPGNIRSDAALSSIFKAFYPNHFFTASMVKSIKAPNAVLCERDKCLNDLEVLAADYDRDLIRKGSGAKRPTMTSENELGEKTEVDAMHTLKAKLDSLNKELRRLQHIPHDTWPSLSVGFVTFNSLYASNSCAQNLLFDNPFSPFIERASEASDIVWSNMRTSSLERFVRKTLVRVTFFGIMVLYFPITVFASALSNLEKVEQEVSFLQGICSWPSFLIDIIQGVLPGLVVKIVLVLIPPISKFLSFLAGYRTYSKIDRSAITKVFYFSVFNIYLIVVIGGSFFDKLSPILDDPKKIISLMAEGIPGQSVFFMNYILLESGTGLTIQLLRLGRFFIYYVKRLFISSHSQLLKARELENAEWHIYVPRMMLIFLIGVSYSTMAPITCFACCLYFGGGHYIFKHQLMYVYGKQYQSGGLLWPKIATQLTGSLLVYQLSMIGVFAAKKLAPETAAAVVLPFLTGLFYYNTYEYVRAFNYSSLAKCSEVDSKRGKDYVEGILSKTYYYRESLTAPSKEFHENSDLYFDSTRYDSGPSSTNNSSQPSQLSSAVVSRIASRATSTLNVASGSEGNVSSGMAHAKSLSTSSLNRNDLFIQSLHHKLKIHSSNEDKPDKDEGL